MPFHQYSSGGSTYSIVSSIYTMHNSRVDSQCISISIAHSTTHSYRAPRSFRSLPIPSRLIPLQPTTPGRNIRRAVIKTNSSPLFSR